VPTYQYACTECGHAFEQFQSFSDDALTECPECGGRLRKIYNAVGVVFKGSGFYRTDSRDSGKPATMSGANGSDSDSGSGSGSSETAAKPDTSVSSTSTSTKSSSTSDKAASPA